MNSYARLRKACTIALLTPLALVVQPAIAATLLTLDRAVDLATRSGDPSLARLEARAEALEQSAVADAQLPDPAVTTQLANVPTDTFSFDQADMTQVRIGLRQEFPPGRTRELRADQRRSEAKAQRARMRLEVREIALATRQAWFELAYQQRAIGIVTRSRESVAQQIQSLSARFATGRLNAQDVLRSELELSLLDDRLTEHRRQADLARASLSRYIGSESGTPLPAEMPELDPPADLSSLVNRLAQHPAVAVESAEMEAADRDVALAEQAYRPALAVVGGYGVRRNRPDFASVGITLSLPLFAAKRQDQRYGAAVRRRGAETLDRDTVLLDLRRRLDRAWSDWQRLGERLELYRSTVRKQARRTAEASLTTYANDRTDFAEVVRSQLAELDAELKLAELEARAGQAWARIAYLAGEQP